MNLLFLVMVGLVVGELEVEEREMAVVEVEEGEDTTLTCPAVEFGECLWIQEDTDTDCQVKSSQAVVQAAIQAAV